MQKIIPPFLCALLAAFALPPQNTQAQTSFGEQQVITANAYAAGAVYATDLDGDGDNDVLSASTEDDKIAWYENNGEGIFAEQQIITTNADGAITVYATDLDGDGDNDVLSASVLDGKIAWYENLSPVGINESPLPHTTSYPNPVRDLLYISPNKAGNYTLYNTLGIAVLQGKCPTPAISVGHLPSGVYYLQLNGEVLRVVKQ